MEKVTIIGAGLAGSEAAWQLLKRGIPVRLYEMRPLQTTPAHHSPYFAELVCSNSLRSDDLGNAVGLLKEEMRQLDSLIIQCADAHRVPAGGALAVDREGFSRAVTEQLMGHPLLEVVHEELQDLPLENLTILATGPLTSPALTKHLLEITHSESLYFYDAAAPIVYADSLDEEKGFWASRYDKGDKDYFNCPMSEEEYRRFYEALCDASVTPARDFEKEIFFEGCMPVEVLASRGVDTLRFGPLKPVGLQDPRKEEKPYAVVQLRQDDAAKALMNIVGFQTRLTRPEQRRVFRMIPGLEQAEFARYGMVHRNTFINAPMLLDSEGRLKARPNVLVAGQVSGVEGYVESAASGLMAGLHASRLYEGKAPLLLPEETAMGALAHYIVTSDPKGFQPMNVTFGLMPAIEGKIRDKKRKKEIIAQRALAALANYKEKL